MLMYGNFAAYLSIVVGSQEGGKRNDEDKDETTSPQASFVDSRSCKCVAGRDEVRPEFKLGVRLPSAEFTFDSTNQRIKVGRLHEIIVYLVV